MLKTEGSYLLNANDELDWNFGVWDTFSPLVPLEYQILRQTVITTTRYCYDSSKDYRIEMGRKVFQTSCFFVFFQVSNPRFSAIYYVPILSSATSTTTTATASSSASPSATSSGGCRAFGSMVYTRGVLQKLIHRIKTRVLGCPTLEG